MKTVPRCRDYLAPARRSQVLARADPTPAPADTRPAPGTNPGGPRPLSPRFAAVAAALYLRALVRRPARAAWPTPAARRPPQGKPSMAK